MTRFQASGPRIDYTPVQSEKPFKQIVGLYNMWQSLSPETREWIANLFRRKGKVKSEPGLDPNIMTDLIRTGGVDWSSVIGIEKPAYEYDRESDEMKRTGGKTIAEALDEENLDKLKLGLKSKYDWSKINPFDESEGTTAMMVFGKDPSRRGSPMMASFADGIVTASKMPDLPTIEEIMATGRMEKPRYRAIAGMSPAVEQFFTGDKWRVR